MTITKTCNTCKHYLNDEPCIGCEWDNANGINTKWELNENPIVIERNVLEQIRAEIEQDMLFYEEDNCNDKDTGFVMGLQHTLDIIDKHMGDTQ